MSRKLVRPLTDEETRLGRVLGRAREMRAAGASVTSAARDAVAEEYGTNPGTTAGIYALGGALGDAARRAFRIAVEALRS